MHRLVPNFIIEKYTARQSNDNFPAIGLFVDISGFSTITDALMTHGQHGAEVLAMLMRNVFEPLVQSVYEQGGFIITFAGDSFTALFPLDEEGIQCYKRALTAAWNIQQRMANVSEQVTPYGTFVLSAKVGTAAGNTNWGIVSAENGTRSAFFFRGTVINDCAAAEEQANPGDIILTPDLYAVTQELFEVEKITVSGSSIGFYRLTQVFSPLSAPETVDLPPIDLEVVARFYPEELTSQSHSGEFRHVVNLFISLPTVRTEAQLSILMQSIFALQDQYGGLFNRLDFGDKGSHLLLFWGAPVAYENDIERALNFTLDLQKQTSIPIKAGVTYRIAHAGFIGSQIREEYTCFGRGVNLAARFMTAAPRGEIWLDEEVARRAELRFDVEFERETVLKGFSEPQRVYTLYERREQIKTTFEGVLLGREAELAQLADFVVPLWDGGYAGAMVVRGEPGIGKSSLVDAFLTDKTGQVSQSCQVYLAQTDQILRQSLNPFRYWLHRYFEQSEAQSESRNKRSFNRVLDRLIDATRDGGLAKELDRTRSFLGVLVGLYWPDSLHEQLDPQGRYENTFIGLTTLLQAESLQQPVVIHLEDAHWLDGDSKAFLAHLARTLTADERKTYPIALIATARSSGDEALLGESLAYQEIKLTQLSSVSMTRLAEGQLGSPADPKLLALLAERAEGNPFFAEQILRYLREGKSLVLGEQGWRLAETELALPLPTDVRAVLVARLDQLAQEVKEVVQTAAVLGREFEVQLLAWMLRDDVTLPWKVTEAERAAIWSRINQLRYLFKHALLRDTAYRMQVRARRGALHGLAVEALEDIHRSELESHYGELAYHSELAGLVDRARHYLKLAGDTAQEAYHNSHAVEYYSRALEVTPEDEAEVCWDLLLARETVNDLLGRRDAQQKDLSALEALADRFTDREKHAKLALRKSELALNTADYKATIAEAQRAVSLAQIAANTALEAAGHRQWGAALREQGAFGAAREQYEIARDQAQTVGDTKTQARSLHDIGSVTYFQSDYNIASDFYEQALDLYRDSTDRRGEGLRLRSLALVSINLGDLSEALSRVEQALRLAQEVGDRQSESRCWNTLANVASREWDLPSAQIYLEEALIVFRQFADRAWEAICLVNLGVAAWKIGDHPGARSNLEQALKIAQEVGNRWVESSCLENLGIMARDMGEYGQAQAYLQQGLVICRELGLRDHEGNILNELGIMAADLGRPDEVQVVLEQALVLRRELGQAYYLAETLVGLAQLEVARGRSDQAQVYVEEVLAILEDSPELSGAERPFRVHLISYQVLRALGDKRADSVLQRAHDLLQARAAKIHDETTRRSFLRNVAAHHEIVQEYSKVIGN